MNYDDIHGLSGAYAVDAVDPVDGALFEAHMSGCSQCQAEVASLRAAATELTSLTLTSPPASLRTAILADIRVVRPLPPLVAPDVAPAPELVESSKPPAASQSPVPTSLESKRSERAQRAPLRQWLAGVAAAAVLATGGLAWHPWTSGTGSVQQIAMEQVLQAKDAQHFEKKVGDATATIVRSPSLKKAVIVTANLPAAPGGKVYELWLQQGATMIRAGLLPAGDANTFLLEGDAASASAVGITVEPAGGSETPTLPPVAVISFA